MNLPGLFIKLLAGNISEVKGKGNITIEGITSSTIVINETEELISEFAKILADKEEIYFVIISDEPGYEWKPFGQKTIIESIKDATKHVKKINIILCFFDSAQIEDETFIAFLKFIKTQTILVLNNLSLNKVEIKKLASIYNDFHVGGCLTLGSPSNFSISETFFNHNMAYFNMPLTTIVGGKKHLSINKVNSDIQLLNELVEIISHMGYKFIAGLGANEEVSRSLIRL